jgi:hypothetical protein
MKHELIGGRRPRAAVPMTPVSTRLDAPHHDALIAQANAQGKSVAALLRELVIKAYGTTQT